MRLVRYILLFCVSLSLSVTAFSADPYINRVFEYCPAPGQFVNVLPKYDEGDDAAAMARKATEAIAGNRGLMVSLGGWGGYIIFGFDHSVVNVEGEPDFAVYGNAFYADANPNAAAPAEGGSCEPGVVMVSADINGNGIPDDLWYELAGSEYASAGTIHGYSVTYTRPEKTDDIPWTDNRGNSGYVLRNIYHSQDYWPQWVGASEMSFTGERLADNAVDESHNGTYWVLYAYPWGYVDNHPNSDPRSRFDISQAVDADGNKVHLP